MMKLEINKAISFLEKGKTIICPTDTICGISCDATNFDAVEKIFKLKKRDYSKSLIVLVSDLKMLKQYIEIIPKKVLAIIKDTKKPLTIIYDNPHNIAKNTLAVDGSVAIRIVSVGFCYQLIKTFGKPIVSSSANFSNDKTALNYSEIDENFKVQIDYVVDEKFDINTSKSSKIIKLLQNDIVVIRD